MNMNERFLKPDELDNLGHKLPLSVKGEPNTVEATRQIADLTLTGVKYDADGEVVEMDTMTGTVSSLVEIQLPHLVKVDYIKISLKPESSVEQSDGFDLRGVVRNDQGEVVSVDNITRSNQ